MTILVSFSISKAQTKQTKSRYHLPTTLNTNDFWQSSRHKEKKKYCLKQTRKKIPSNQVFLLASIRLGFAPFELCTVHIY